MSKLQEKNCVTCGKKYQPNSARQKYCSERCKRGVSTCIVCGKKFVPKGNTTGRFCSSDCWYTHNTSEKQPNICPVCNKEFFPTHRRQKHCSYACADIGRRTPRKYTHCLNCGKSLEGKHKRQKFCSVSCSHTGRDGRKTTEKPVGARSRTSSGYVQIKVGKDHPSSASGWMLEHRYVMEQGLGRYLEPHERVHHKNGQRDDNRLENLELWTTQKKDPPGQRVIDRVKHNIEGLPMPDKIELLTWLRRHIDELD